MGKNLAPSRIPPGWIRLGLAVTGLLIVVMVLLSPILTRTKTPAPTSTVAVAATQTALAVEAMATALAGLATTPAVTPVPTATPTPYPMPTDTPIPPTLLPPTPTDTPVPTDTPIPPTPLPPTPTDTLVPTNTPIPPTSTPLPPTETPTPVPPTDTPPPTATPVPTAVPTATPYPMPTPVPCTTPPIEDLSFNPGSPATMGTTVNVHAKATWNSCFRSMRLKIDGNIVYELGSPEWNYSWNTSGYSVGNHTVRLEVAAQGDNSWSNPSVREETYTLQSTGGLSKPTLVSLANGALLPPGTDVTLQWNPVSGATQYLVEIWGGQYGGTHATPCGWQSGTSCHIGTMSPGNVLWRVKARDSAGNESPWSDEWNFTPQ
jgi:hypothetical protein